MKKAVRQPRIVGTGYAVPENIRKNDDPIFQWLKDNPPSSNPFDGYDERRVLGLEDDVVTLMIESSYKALSNANMETSDVDLILGSASIGKFLNPNQLAQVHRDMHLRKDCWAIPITNDFSNFNAALVIATSLIRAGRAKTILIVLGTNWTRNVDYHTPQSISAGDGAGAVVVSLSDDADCFYLKDDYTIMATEYFGGMYTSGTPIITSDNTVLADGNTPAQGVFAPFPKNDKLYHPIGYDTLFSHHFFHINELGMACFMDFALPVAPKSALEVMKRNNLTGADITYMPHQTSQKLIDAWVNVIQPAQELDTIRQFGNLEMATAVVNLAYAIEHNLLEKNNLVLMALGNDMHVNSMLLEREGK